MPTADKALLCVERWLPQKVISQVEHAVEDKITSELAVIANDSGV